MDFFKKIFRSHPRTQKHSDTENDNPVQMVSPHVEDNLTYIREALFHTEDLKTRELSYQGRKGVLVYLNTMADFSRIQDGILRPMALSKGDKPLEEVLASPQVETEEELDPAVEQLLHGHIIRNAMSFKLMPFTGGRFPSRTMRRCYAVPMKGL